MFHCRPPFRDAGVHCFSIAFRWLLMLFSFQQTSLSVLDSGRLGRLPESGEDLEWKSLAFLGTLPKTVTIITITMAKLAHEQIKRKLHRWMALVETIPKRCILTCANDAKVSIVGFTSLCMPVAGRCVRRHNNERNRCRSVLNQPALLPSVTDRQTDRQTERKLLLQGQHRRFVQNCARN